MRDFSDPEEKHKHIQYILNNGYTSKEKINLLEKLGIQIRVLHGENQENFYNRNYDLIQKS